MTATLGHAATTNDLPKFDEVYQLLRTHLEGATSEELDRAAVKGFLAELHGRAMLVENSNGTSAASSTALSKTAVYDGAFAYFRIDRVESDLPEKFHATYQELVQTNKSKIKGIILDLRFAGGSDYAAAAATADVFMNSDHPLLEWGSHSASATKKADVIAVPVAILVNSETSGAAEALAAALREEEIGLVLGGVTAGQANLFKEFPLQDGGQLRIATSPIKLGDGSTLAHGLKPDIAIGTDPGEEKGYMKDPYKILHPPEVVATASIDTNQPPHHRFNEAELVRERREGKDPEEEFENESSGPEEQGPPVISDPSLARALDLLKGLAVIQQSRPG